MTIEELAQTVRQYGDDLFSFCCYVTGNRPDAEDLYQDTFLKAVEIRSKIKANQNVKSYLMGIAVNLNHNQRRKRQKQDYMECMDILDEHLVNREGCVTIEEAYVYEETLREVRQLVDMLPDKLRKVALLYYSGSLSTKEIAEILHIPKGTVLSRLVKVREVIKTGLEAKGYEV